MIFIDLQIFTGSVSHDVHSNMRRFLKVYAHIKRFFHWEGTVITFDQTKSKHV